LETADSDAVTEASRAGSDAGQANGSREAKPHPELDETGKAGRLEGVSAVNDHVAVPMKAATAQYRGEVTPHIPRDISVRVVRDSDKSDVY